MDSKIRSWRQRVSATMVREPVKNWETKANWRDFAQRKRSRDAWCRAVENEPPGEAETKGQWWCPEDTHLRSTKEGLKWRKCRRSRENRRDRIRSDPLEPGDKSTTSDPKDFTKMPSKDSKRRTPTSRAWPTQLRGNISKRGWQTTLLKTWQADTERAPTTAHGNNPRLATQ